MAFRAPEKYCCAQKQEPTGSITVPTIYVEGRDVDLKTYRIIMNGHICPYCHGKTEYVDSAQIYSRNYGIMVYLCRPCQAWVGCHRDNDQALGRLAKADLREAKINAHASFDTLWVKKMKKDNITKKEARTKAYRWLAKEMGTPVEFTHIGMFNVTQCLKVIELCRPWI